MTPEMMNEGEGETENDGQAKTVTSSLGGGPGALADGAAAAVKLLKRKYVGGKCHWRRK